MILKLYLHIIWIYFLQDEGIFKEIPATHHVKEGYEKAEPCTVGVAEGSWSRIIWKGNGYIFSI